jgi:hypothetical protein
MSKSRKTKQNADPPASAAAGSRFPRPVVVVLAVAVVAAGGFWWSQRRQADAPPTAVPATVFNATKPPGPSATSNPGFDKLKGQWLRPDGGYIIEVRSVEPGGKMDAAYFNPRPIHVAKAEASQEGETVKVFIELRDVNYPGSTYNLVYEAKNDQLAGIYYQAALQERFEVVFERMK